VELTLAVEALGKLAPPGAAGEITPLLSHASSEVRAEAAHALFRLRFSPVWRGMADNPPELPPESVEALVNALSDPSAAVRRMAAHAFSRYPDTASIEALTQVRNRMVTAYQEIMNMPI